MSQRKRDFNMQLTEEEKQNISKIIDRLIVEKIKELGVENDIIKNGEILTEAKQTVVDFVVEGQT